MRRTDETSDNNKQLYTLSPATIYAPTNALTSACREGDMNDSVRSLAPKPQVMSSIWTAPAIARENGQANQEADSSLLDETQVGRDILQKAITPPPEARLRMSLISTIESLNLQRSWWMFAPSRIGSSASVDAAARALISACNYSFRKDQRSLRSAYETHGLALIILRQNLDISDETLVSIALLSPTEGLLGLEPEKFKARFKHWQAIGSILLSRASSFEPTDIVRAMFSRMWECTVRVPCALGQPSPFERGDWLDLEPVTMSSPGLMDLTRANNRLSIRLPRLMAYIRSFHAAFHPRLVEEAATLALELLRLEDIAAESLLLHHVNISQTHDHFDRAIVTHSFQFESTSQMEIALMYWQNQITLVRLCVSLFPLAEESEEHHSAISSLLSRKKSLINSQTRMITNVLMSWQYASSRGMLGGCLWFRHGFPIIWGALRESNVIEINGRSVKSIREWVLMRIHDTLPGWNARLDNAAMDQAAKAFVGGSWDAPWLDM